MSVPRSIIPNNYAPVYLLSQVHRITIKGIGRHKRNKFAIPFISTTITGKTNFEI